MNNLSPHHEELLATRLSELFSEFKRNKHDGELFVDHFGDSPEECIAQRLGSCSRSKIFLLLVDIIGDGDERTCSDLALAIELLHQSTLIIDDAQDRAARRKGRPTLWSLHGDCESLVFAFQLSYYAANRISAHFPTSNEAAQLTTSTGIRMIVGQRLDLHAEWSRSKEQYFKIAEEKTGRLYALPAELACFISNRNHQGVRSQLQKLMLTVGVSHQICDDLQDAASASSNAEAFADSDAVIQNIRQSIFGVADCPLPNEPIFKFTTRRMSFVKDQLRERFSEVLHQLMECRKCLHTQLDDRELALWDTQFEPFVRELSSGENGI